MVLNTAYYKFNYHKTIKSYFDYNIPEIVKFSLPSKNLKFLPYYTYHKNQTKLENYPTPLQQEK